MSKIIKDNIDITGLLEKEVAKLTIKQIRIELRKAVMTLKEIQREERRLRELWLEEMAMKNAIENGDQDAQRVLKTMLRKMSTKAMNDKLKMINHGYRGGLDYIEVPKGEWLKSEKNGELFWYNNGVFEAYPKNGEIDGEYKKYHVIKVIPDDAVEVSVEENDESFIVKIEGEKI